ncbi:hypothetical protein [Streptomyces sp. NPDC101132]|uniref:hypothetical protein n=1 Tax=Streptomyces sp. NPDC101132 TaxID=3366110 RepID=UPI0037FAE126
MESGPAIFAGVVFTLFGAGMLLWTGACAVRREPVAEGVRPGLAVPVAALAGAVSVALGVWCFARP